MISSNVIRRKVEQYVAGRDKYPSKSHPERFLPKKAYVVNATPEGEQRGYREGTMHTERGRAYSHFDRLVQRVVFRPEPVEINGEQFYLEVKGYGFGGRNLFPFHHCEGDLNFGMYFDNAQKEYDLLNISAQNKDLLSHLPVALLQFPRDEFVYQCLRGIGKLLLDYSVDTFGKTEKSIADNLLDKCQKRGIEKVMSQVRPSFHGLDHITNQFASINKPAGYLVRATRCPFRIACMERLNVPKEQCDEAAYRAGELYSFMLRQGLLHQVPGECNITLAGELMDFEDMDKVTNTREIRKCWKFMAKQFGKKEKVDSFRDYLALTLGKQFLGEFIVPFLKGAGLGNSPYAAADSIIAMHEKAFRPLLS
jgi:hypothetical protein